MKKQPRVILLAGGKSERFWPFFQKNLIPFFGKLLIEHQIQVIRKSGFTDIVVVANSTVAAVMKNLGIPTVIQEGNGIAQALISAKEYIQSRSVLTVFANDIVDQQLFEGLYDKLSKDSKTGFISTYQPPYYLPMGYVELEGERIKNIVEKPGEGKEPSKQVNISTHFHPNGDTLLAYLSRQKSSKDDIYEKAFSTMMNESVYKIFEYNGPFAYLKYPWHVILVMEVLLLRIKEPIIAESAVIHENAVIQGPVWIEEGVRVMEYAKIVGPCYIGRNTIIGNNTMIRESHIGEQCVIGFGSDVARSYIGALSWLHTNYVGDSVLGEDVSIGSGTVLANLRLDEGEVNSVMQDELISSKRDKLGAIIGDHVRIGVNASIMPGVKIGKGSVVGAGVLLAKDLLDDKRCYIKQVHTINDQKTRSTKSKRNKFRKKI